jgi:cell division transport system permease protein
MAGLFRIKKEVNIVHKIWNSLLLNIKRERMISISNVFIMTITFLLLGFFITLVVASQTTTHYLEQQAQITVFFKDDFNENNILQYKSNLEKDKRISFVKYVSKDEAFKIFSEVNKNEPLLLDSVSASILPASLEVKTVKLQDLATLATEFKAKDGVEEVRYFKDVIDKFKNFTTIVYVVGGILVTIFILISYSVIIATLRATINSKGVELEILKLVGASDAYVKKPLILQGIMFGLVSAVSASILLAMFLLGFIALPNHLLQTNLYLLFNPLWVVNPLGFVCTLTLLLVLSGCLLGYIGSNSAVKKYLKY